MENKMLRSVRVFVATSTVLLLLGWAVPAESRQDQQDKPKNQEKRQEPANKQQDQRHQEQHQQAREQQDQQKQTGQQQGQRDNSAKQQAGGQRQQHPDNSARQNQQQAKRQQDQQRAQQDQQQDNSANQQVNRRQDQQQQQRQQEDNSAKQQQQQAQQRQQDNRSAQQRSPAQARRQQVAWQDDRAYSWHSEHRTWQQRGGYNGYRVPEDRFRDYYGRDHGFRIYSLPVRYVGGHRRFQCGGYWFGLVDPWPEYWSNDWYDSDDVYVDYYGDGYYLYNRRHPGDRIAISFYLN
jgi:hypothetical protein